MILKNVFKKQATKPVERNLWTRTNISPIAIINLTKTAIDQRAQLNTLFPQKT